MLHRVNLRSAFVIVFFFLTACLVGVGGLVWVEKQIAQSAQQYIQHSPYQSDVLEIAQQFHRIYCSSHRHRNCSVEVVDENEIRLASVPTALGGSEGWQFSNSIFLPQFLSPVNAVLRYRPAFLYLLEWISASLGLAGFSMLVLYWGYRLHRQQETVKRYQVELRLAQAEAGIGELALQVAHDIRSPLSALNLVVDSAGQLPSSERNLLKEATRRINDIANNLLTAGKPNGKERAALPVSAFADVETHVIELLCDGILSEKRIEYSKRAGISLEGNLLGTFPRGFARVNRAEFQRVLSNLINNAVEAIGEERGHIDVSCQVGINDIKISVKDNGPGIPEPILSKLGKERVSFRKQFGNGLGLPSAFQIVQSWGGKIEIDSELGNGTCVTISLTMAEPPSWWLTQLTIGNQAVAIVDDDPSIHEMWGLRLPQEAAVTHFYNPIDFIHWWNVGQGKVVVLMDHEFPGCHMSGIELIRKLNLASCAVLVSGCFDDPNVTSTCEYEALKLLPKPLVPHIPIEVASSVDAVLIDDDPLVRVTWMLKARSVGKQLRVWPSLEDALPELAELDRGISVYVDLHLGDSTGGLTAVKRINELGFSSVVLTTGDQNPILPKEFEPWIQSRIGKNPPWTCKV